MSTIAVVGLDLAKHVFQVHGVDASGKVILRRQLRRAEVERVFAQMAPCLIGMEACYSAHYWARALARYGHTVRLMAPQFVRPYVKTNKNDAADAEAICEAVTRPNMRFVPVKSPDQQAMLALHRARQGLMKARVAQTNQIRSMVAEFGVALPQGPRAIRLNLVGRLEHSALELPPVLLQLVRQLLEHLHELESHLARIEVQIKQWHRHSAQSKLLETIPGIGPITATALVASVGDASHFKNGRQMAAWLGLVPRQHSTGGKARLLSISKRGDVYLRTLLTHGARALTRLAADPSRPGYDWLRGLLGRRHANVATIALANKNARIAWAVLTRETPYRA
jgi:transposase